MTPIQPLPGHAERIPPGVLPPDGDAVAADRRRRILRVTAELVGKRGYHGTTVELIVRRARMGRPAFNSHFPDKEAAFLALFQGAAGRVERLLHRAAGVGSTGDDGDGAGERPWPERVQAALLAFFAEIDAEPLIARACLVEVLTAGPAAVERYERALHDVAHPILFPGRALNPHATRLSDSLEDTLAGGIAWIVYQRLVAGEAERIPALLPEALEFVLLPYLGEKEAAPIVSACVEEASA